MRNIGIGVFYRATSHARLLGFSIILVASFTAHAQTREDGRGLSMTQSDTVKQLPSKTKRFALVIGVDRYSDTQITTLGGSVNDAKTLASALVQYAGFPSDQVTLLTDDQPAERQPTRGNILRRLSNLAAVIPRDGLLLLSFAGHGVERGGQAFLLPSDAQVSNDVDLLEQTAINVTQVKDRIKKTGVGQVVLILDACRNDPVGRANADNPLTPAFTSGFNFDVRNREVSAFATLYATAVGARAYEYKEKKQGYFTWMLVEGLRGKAANERGEVTLASLIKYLQERVPKQVLLDLGSGKEQKPFAVVEGYRADELVIAAPGQRVAEAADRAIVSEQPAETVAGAATQSNASDRSSTTSLEGTVWTGTSVESGEFTIEFLKDGKIRYTIRTGSVGGTWKQSGNYVQVVIGNGYSVSEGNIEGSLIRMEGSNQEGKKWRWVLTQKDK